MKSNNLMPTPRPQRIQQSRRKGWRKPVNTVCVGRPSRFGNPFLVSEHGREKAIALFEEWIQRPVNAPLLQEVRRVLRGRNLGCWCRPCPGSTRRAAGPYRGDTAPPGHLGPECRGGEGLAPNAQPGARLPLDRGPPLPRRQGPRAQAGLKGYSGMWDPAHSIYLYQLASILDSKYQPVLEQIIQNTGDHRRGWLALLVKAGCSPDRHPLTMDG